MTDFREVVRGWPGLVRIAAVTLQPMSLPTDPESWLPFVSERADADLKLARECVAELTDGKGRPPKEVLARWNDLEVHLRSVADLTELMQVVHPEEAVRSTAEHWNQEWSRAKTERDLDRSLFDVMVGLDISTLDDAAQRVHARALREFRRAGVDREPEVRERLGQIAERSTELAQEFSRRIRDGVAAIRVAPTRLAGLPADFVESHPVGDDGLVTLTTEWSDRNAVMKYAADGALRREVVGAHERIGWPENDAVLRELIDLRTEQARLLGYDGWPDFDAEVRMIASGPAIGEFIDDLDELARPAVRREIDVLLDFVRADDPSATGLGRQDFRYYIELARRERYDVDAQQVRRYFDFGRVREGLFDVTGRLFGLDYRDVLDVPVWHSDVTVHDVYAAGTEQLLGRVYLDLHPRPGKYSHAAQFTLVAGVADRQIPEAVLVGNFAQGLVDHYDVMVMFHEFGHVLHHMFSGSQPWLAFSGAEAAELDFIEAPSQLLEEWAWDADVLRSFAIDAAGTPIPAELVERMRVAEEFGKGLETARQVFYTAVSYAVHLPGSGDLNSLVADLERRYDPLVPLEDGHVHAGFEHLIGYDSAYYTYQWSLVIAKDLFAAFDPADLLDPEIGRRYRDSVLAPGGSRDATQLIESFLGRPPSFEPFRRWLTDADTA